MGLQLVHQHMFPFQGGTAQTAAASFLPRCRAAKEDEQLVTAAAALGGPGRPGRILTGVTLLFPWQLEARARLRRELISTHLLPRSPARPTAQSEARRRIGAASAGRLNLARPSSRTARRHSSHLDVIMVWLSLLWLLGTCFQRWMGSVPRLLRAFTRGNLGHTFKCVHLSP